MYLKPIKIYIFSVILNVMDMITSFIDFQLGYIELNAWTKYIHNPYLSCLMAIIMYQILMTILYVITLHYEKAKAVMTVITLIKLYPIINNVTVTRV